MQKIKFILKNNLRVHKLFYQAIKDVDSLIQKGNKKIIMCSLPSVFWIGFLFLFLLITDFYNLLEYENKVTGWVFWSAWIVSVSFVVIYIYFRNVKLIKIKKLANSLIIDNDSKLFAIESELTNFTVFNHNDIFKNCQGRNYYSSGIDQNIELSYIYFSKTLKARWSFWLNRDILSSLFNGNKLKARAVHYLLIVYSNDKNQKFYNPEYKENIKYFLDLEKYYQK
ncbi:MULTISPECIES: hypothetical protein [unclassified Mycoplasma]|uniref:hypothetical protein n=1 Tax=unclassified Mycoplasma TaxID=2683645 RepID=UPI00211C038E|nr:MULTISPECIES: hypothetical protein [unclassified Mycoplasma]UUM19921.1 hypothetical protein NPA11_00575 [Mycoplasma sp. 1578d]UUM24902.1 hypothetical protein NPA12_00560 [Mycoplasma sp. 3686d]